VRARALIEGASYDPETVKALCRAFDEAWNCIKDRFYFENEIESARRDLASAMLAIGWRHGHDVDALKNAALEHMALSYRARTLLSKKIAN
jgi:hypothetical protein